MDGTSHLQATDDQRGANVLDERWLRPIELAKHLGYADDAVVRRAIFEGALPAFRPSKRMTLIRESDALAWIEGCRIEPSGEFRDPDLRATSAGRSTPSGPLRLVRRCELPVPGGAVIRQ